MSITVSEIFDDVRVLLDEWTDDGVTIPDADVVDLQSKTILLASKAQRELYKIGRFLDVVTITRTSTPNLLGEEFDIEEFTGTDQYYPNEDGVAGAQAYYFEVDDNATVTIEEKQSGSWVAIETLTVSGITEMTAYKGILSVSDTSNAVRMKFSGSTYYRHKNRALFSYLYSSASKVPSYRPFYKVDMPTGFQSVDQVVSETYEDYTYRPNLRWERGKDLYLPYDFEGTLRITYNPIPDRLTAITDELDVDDLAGEAISYYVAARLAPFENKSLVNYFEQKYDQLKEELSRDFKVTEEYMTDVYS